MIMFPIKLNGKITPLIFNVDELIRMSIGSVDIVLFYALLTSHVRGTCCCIASNV